MANNFTPSDKRRVRLFVGGEVERNGQPVELRSGSYVNLFDRIVTDTGGTLTDYFGVAGIEDINLYLTQELDFSMKYEKGDTLKKIRDSVTKAGSFTGGVADVIAFAQESSSGKTLGRYFTKLISAPSWQTPEPLEIKSLTFDFNIGMNGVWSGRQEVYNPMMALARVALASPGEGSRLVGPLPANSEIYAGLFDSALSGVAAATADGQDFLSDFLSTFENKMAGQFSGAVGKVRMQYGNIFLPDFIVPEVSVKFSNELDSEGYPIRGTISWNGMQSLIIPTTTEFGLKSS